MSSFSSSDFDQVSVCSPDFSSVPDSRLTLGSPVKLKRTKSYHQREVIDCTEDSPTREDLQEEPQEVKKSKKKSARKNKKSEEPLEFDEVLEYSTQPLEEPLEEIEPLELSPAYSTPGKKRKAIHQPEEVDEEKVPSRPSGKKSKTSVKAEKKEKKPSSKKSAREIREIGRKTDSKRRITPNSEEPATDYQASIFKDIKSALEDAQFTQKLKDFVQVTEWEFLTTPTGTHVIYTKPEFVQSGEPDEGKRKRVYCVVQHLGRDTERTVKPYKPYAGVSQWIVKCKPGMNYYKSTKAPTKPKKD